MKLNQEWPQRLSLRPRRIEGRSVGLSCILEHLELILRRSLESMQKQ